MSDSSDDSVLTVLVNYAGRVQGVGFRYTTREIAGHHPVAGYVKNLPDGSVELVAQGLPVDVERFLAAVAERFRGNLRGTNRRSVTVPEEFTTFDIRH